MAITRLQHTIQAFSQSASARTLAFPGNVTAGSLLAVVVGLFNNRLDTVTVSDSVNGSYTQAGSYAQVNSWNVSLWYFKNSAGGSTPTVTVTPSANDFLTFGLLEYSGVDTTAPLDNTNKATGTSASASAGQVTCVGTELAIFAYTQGTGTLASNSTLDQSFSLVDEVLNGSATEGLGIADNVATATVTPTFTLASSVTWAAIIASFKSASGGGGSTFAPLLPLLGVG